MVRFFQCPSRTALTSFGVSWAILFVAAGAFRPASAFAHADRKLEGAELFATRGCTHCHGDSGEGTENGPPLRTLRKHLSANRIRLQIVHGGKQMPAFGDTLDSQQVGSLVEFLRAKTWIAAPKSASEQATPVDTKPQP